MTPSTPRRRRHGPSHANGTRTTAPQHGGQPRQPRRRGPPATRNKAKPVQLDDGHDDDDVTELEAMLAMIEVSAAALPRAHVSKAADPMHGEGDEDSESPVDDEEDLARHVKTVHERGSDSTTAASRSTDGAVAIGRPVNAGFDDDEMLVSDSEGSDDDLGQPSVPTSPRPIPTQTNASHRQHRARQMTPETKSTTRSKTKTPVQEPTGQFMAFVGNICPHACNADIVSFIASLTANASFINPRPARPHKHITGTTSTPSSSHVRGVYVTFASNAHAVDFVQQVNCLNAKQCVQIAAEGEQGRVWVSYVDLKTGKQVGWRARNQGSLHPANKAKLEEVALQTRKSWRSSPTKQEWTPAAPAASPRRHRAHNGSHDEQQQLGPQPSAHAQMPPPLPAPARRVPWRPPGGPLEMMSTGVVMPDPARTPRHALAQVYLKPKPLANHDPVTPGVTIMVEVQEADEREIDEDRMTASEDDDEDVEHVAGSGQEGARAGLGRVGW